MPEAISPGFHNENLLAPGPAEELLKSLHIPLPSHQHHATSPRPPGPELAAIVRQHGNNLGPLTTEQQRALRAIATCRTVELGGHVARCDHCGHIDIFYDSCRNRSCPKCQGLSQLRWVEKRKRDLLPVQYHHPVFTISHHLNPLFLANPRIAYALLFAAVAETLLEVAANPDNLGAKIGFVTVLHTWTQTLLYHPHIHCIIAGGGLSNDHASWIPCRKDFFLPVHILSTVFRAKLLSKLQAGLRDGTLRPPTSDDPQLALNKAATKNWNVYSKPSFAGPEHVIEYLGRYTHRIAISDHRLVAFEDNEVTFHYKDRPNGDKRSYMTLPAEDFLRRFLLHILPAGFVRVRYYGFLANSHRNILLELIRQILGVVFLLLSPQPGETFQQLLLRLTGRDITLCSNCKLGHFTIIAFFLPSGRSHPTRAPP